jgi:hypothetical protein
MAIELTILMPCLDEAETIALCIRKAQAGASVAGAMGAEILVADNGSADGSVQRARAAGARVVSVSERGYGAALRGGIEAARGHYIIMGDADDSYDFSEISPLLEKLRMGWPLVVGSRLRGSILPGAMPWLHRLVGNPVLTWLANLFFGTRLSDYHSGLRGFEAQSIRGLGLRTSGMEFASEMLIRASMAGMPICEVPIVYSPAGRSRRPHLRTWSDGWRHLRFLLLYSPRWVLLYPGITLAAVGLMLTTALMFGPLRLGAITLDVHTLLVSSTLLSSGILLMMLAVYARAYASRMGLLPWNTRLELLLDKYSPGVGLFAGPLLSIAGVALYAWGLVAWGENAFGPITHYQTTLRVVIAGTTFITIGVETFLGSFVLSLLNLHSEVSPQPPA